METKKEEIMKQDGSVGDIVVEQPRDSKNTKKGIKYKAAVALLIIVGIWIGWNLGVYTYLNVYIPYTWEHGKGNWMSECLRISMKRYEEFEKAYKNDFIGGSTPEETVDLFIDALKKEDYELVVKYFEVQEQEGWRERLKTPIKKNLDEWANELENNKNSWHKDNTGEDEVEFWYNTGEGENERTNSIYLRKNTNNKWKIRRF